MAYDDDDDVDELFERAKAKYRQERSRERERIKREEGYAYDWTQSVIGFLSAIASVFAAVWNSCCYISTAVARHFNLPDDCHYLRVLRRYRDRFILHGGEEVRVADLEHYYSIAPWVVNWIESQSNSGELWAGIAETVVEAVARIERGDDEGAYSIYRERVLGIWERAARDGGSSGQA